MNSYEKWEKKQELSALSPEAWWAEIAWNAAIAHAAGCVESILNGNNDLPEDYSDEQLMQYLVEELTKLDTGFRPKT